jgi:hypothetical protein
MFKSPEVPVHPVTPREAVADAMMIVQGRYIKDAVRGRSYFKKIESEQDFLDTIDYSSKHKCKPSAEEVVRRLSQNHGDLFDKLTSIQTWGDLKDFPYHSLFLAHGVDGAWYAGSASNNDNKRGKRRFSIIYESPDLDVILDMIKRDEGGEWPSSKDVSQKITKEESRFYLKKFYDRHKPISYNVRFHGRY